MENPSPLTNDGYSNNPKPEEQSKHMHDQHEHEKHDH